MSAWAAWLRSVRLYSLTASVMPVALGVILAITHANNTPVALTWWPLPLFVTAALLFHAGTNVLNDYYDHLHGVDPPDDADPTHVIPQGVVTPRFMRVSGGVYFGAGLLIGLPIAVLRGPWFLLAGMIGLLGGLLYTNKRFSLKYVALGDVVVFVLMGPALVGMTHWTLTATVPIASLLISLPVALLVTAILHGNNLRDRERDRKATIHTLAGLVPESIARIGFVSLLAGAYCLTVILIVARVLPLTALLVLLSVPRATRIALHVLRVPDVSSLVALPLRCAGLHLAFSTLLILALLPEVL